MHYKDAIRRRGKNGEDRGREKMSRNRNATPCLVSKASKLTMMVLRAEAG